MSDYFLYNNANCISNNYCTYNFIETGKYQNLHPHKITFIHLKD